MVPTARRTAKKRRRVTESALSVESAAPRKALSTCRQPASSQSPPDDAPAQVATTASCVAASPEEGSIHGARTGLLSLPDAVILSIMEFAKYGRRRRIGEEKREPCVLVGVDKAKATRRQGGSGGSKERAASELRPAEWDACRALASTCRRLRDLFRFEFVSTFRVFTSHRPAVVVGDCESMNSYSTAFMSRVFEVLKRYSRGVRHLDVLPAFVLYSVQRVQQGDFERGGNRDVGGHLSIGTLCPRLESVRVGSQWSLYTSVESASSDEDSGTPQSELKSRILEELAGRVGDMLPRGVDRGTMSIEKQLRYFLNLELYAALSAVLFGCRFLEFGRIEGLDRALRVSSGRSGVISFGEEPLRLSSPCFANMKSLTVDGEYLEEFPWAVLPRLSLERLEVFGNFFRERDAYLLSESLPESLTSLKYRLETKSGRFVRLDLSTAHGLEELELFISDVHGTQNEAPDSGFDSYVSTLETVNASKLKRLHLCFAVRVFAVDTLDPWTSTSFRLRSLETSLERLNTLEELHLTIPIQFFGAFLGLGARPPSLPAVHFTLSNDIFAGFGDDYREHGDPCVYSVLEQLRRPEGRCIASIGFYGDFGCAHPRAISEIEIEARRLSSRFEGISNCKGTRDEKASIVCRTSTCAVHLRGGLNQQSPGKLIDCVAVNGSLGVRPSSAL